MCGIARLLVLVLAFAQELFEFFAQIFWLADDGQVDAKGRIHP